ncbi:hypothetical protein [Beihai anemone virus 1]|uniref:hypothetical protein n=1 Tax=Beihai anemone virus 1 TaxID=1922352 RepID=UPI00090B5B7A|nr:hypothetical protein [Beihai anemone virus 1]APG77550.1 hypothetical protein [Beihai anemone virus 1]
MIPYVIGDPVKSFVLVPGTGRNKNFSSDILDLARVSTVAGAIPVIRPTKRMKPSQMPREPETIPHLRRKIESLENEKRELQKRLNMFHELFKDKRRIESFLKLLLDQSKT